MSDPNPTPAEITGREWDQLRRLLTQELAMWDKPGVYADGIRCGIEGALTYMDAITNQKQTEASRA